MHSEHFTEKELTCRCGCGLNLATPGLLKALEQLRELAHAPVFIDSATRCKKRNAAVGGAPNSYHLAGMAADIRIKALEPQEMRAIALQIPEIRGIGSDYLRGYIHVDVRNAPRTEWCYSPTGAVIPFYLPE